MGKGRGWPLHSWSAEVDGWTVLAFRTRDSAPSARRVSPMDHTAPQCLQRNRSSAKTSLCFAHPVMIRVSDRWQGTKWPFSPDRKEFRHSKAKGVPERIGAAVAPFLRTGRAGQSPIGDMVMGQGKRNGEFSGFFRVADWRHMGIFQGDRGTSRTRAVDFSICRLLQAPESR